MRVKVKADMIKRALVPKTTPTPTVLVEMSTGAAGEERSTVE